jgi:hypothetical protein
MRPGPGISVDNPPHIRKEKAILLGKTIIVNLFQRFKIVLNVPIVLRFIRVVGLVNGKCDGHFLIQKTAKHPRYFSLFGCSPGGCGMV